jgi:hypothetical protein
VCSLNIVAIIAAGVLVLAVHFVAGRLVSLGMTAVCSAAMAFFLMPPVHSFRISQTSDRIALGLYSALGLVVAKSAPSRKKRAIIREGPRQNNNLVKLSEVDTQVVMTELMSSDVGARLRVAGVAVDVADVRLPCLYQDALRILTDVVTAALRDTGIRHISIYGGKRPGAQFLIVTAHRVWPSPLYKVITIGQREEDCVPAVFSGWPAHSKANWFDNGYDRIYQVSIAV